MNKLMNKLMKPNREGEKENEEKRTGRRRKRKREKNNIFLKQICANASKPRPPSVPDRPHVPKQSPDLISHNSPHFRFGNAKCD